MSDQGSITRRVQPFAYLAMAASQSIEYAERDEEGCFYNALNCIVASAFYLEALLNEIGSRVVPCWSEIERSLSPRQKLIVVTERIGFEPDLGCAPYQAFTQLFAIRNLLAHGRPETVSGQYPGSPKTRWEEACTPETARALFDQAHELGLDLWQRFDYPKTEFYQLSGAEFWQPA